MPPILEMVNWETIFLMLGKYGILLFQLEHTVVHVVEALHYKPEGHRFNTHRSHWNLKSFCQHYGPQVN
jgi:hypothetical protein